MLGDLFFRSAALMKQYCKDCFVEIADGVFFCAMRGGDALPHSHNPTQLAPTSRDEEVAVPYSPLASCKLAVASNALVQASDCLHSWTRYDFSKEGQPQNC